MFTIYACIYGQYKFENDHFFALPQIHRNTVLDTILSEPAPVKDVASSKDVL